MSKKRVSGSVEDDREKLWKKMYPNEPMPKREKNAVAKYAGSLDKYGVSGSGLKEEIRKHAKSIKQLINQQEPEMNFTTDVACGMLCDLPKECDKPCSWIEFMTERNLVNVDVVLGVLAKAGLFSAEKPPLKTSELQEEWQSIINEFPHGKIAFPLECNGGETDKLCHENEQTYVDGIIAVTHWFEKAKEFGLLLAKVEAERNQEPFLRKGFTEKLQEVISKLNEIKDNLAIDGASISGWGYYANTIEDLVKILEALLGAEATPKTERLEP